jgi:hypothetical protein
MPQHEGKKFTPVSKKKQGGTTGLLIIRFWMLCKFPHEIEF